LLKLLVIVISSGLALGGAELALRAHNPFGFRMRGNTLVLPANKVYDIRADQASRSDQLDAHVIHTKNSLGFRGPEPPDDFADWLMLLAVGGSTTEGFYLSDGRTWPERLAVRLRPELRMPSESTRTRRSARSTERRLSSMRNFPRTTQSGTSVRLTVRRSLLPP
jgi:hypothetical protein